MWLYCAAVRKIQGDVGTLYYAWDSSINLYFNLVKPRGICAGLRQNSAIKEARVFNDNDNC